LQVQQLPQDPFHPRFMSELLALGEWVDAAGRPVTGQKQLHTLGLIPALLQRLQRLCTHSICAPSEGTPEDAREAPASAPATPSCGGPVPAASDSLPGSAGDAATPVSQPGGVVAPPAPISVETLRLMLKETMQPLSSMFWDHTHNIGDATYAALALGHLERLMSCPDALRAVVRRGLSAEVREAARGGSAAAANCMTQAHNYVGFWVHLLQTQMEMIKSIDDLGRVQALEAKLAALLNHAEVVPLLELLCLPLDPGGRLCTLHVCQDGVGSVCLSGNPLMHPFMGELAHPNELAQGTTPVHKRRYMHLIKSPRSWCFHGAGLTPRLVTPPCQSMP
jgi:hypothetical protein